MRAGHALAAGMEMVAHEAAQPVGGEFRRVVEEWKLGRSWDQALEHLSERMPLVSVSLFVAAIRMQSRTGGKLHEVLARGVGWVTGFNFAGWGNSSHRSARQTHWCGANSNSGRDCSDAELVEPWLSRRPYRSPDREVSDLCSTLLPGCRTLCDSQDSGHPDLGATPWKFSYSAEVFSSY